MIISRLKNRTAAIPKAPLAIAVLIMAAALSLYHCQPALTARLDMLVYDALLPLRAQTAPLAVPVIIDIDEAATKEYGTWPWSHAQLAALTDKLTDYYGVRVVGLNFILRDADRTSVDQLMDALQRDRDVDFDYSGSKSKPGESAQVLALALKQNRAVIAARARYRADRSEEPVPDPSLKIAVEGKPAYAASAASQLRQAKSASLPLPLLQKAADLGFINIIQDDDGKVRTVPAVVRIHENLYPSLSVSAVMHYLDADSLVLEAAARGFKTMRLGKHSVRISPDGTFRIPFVGPQKTYPYYSAADVLDSRISMEALQGRIALVGFSRPSLGSPRPTPRDRSSPAVEIQAAAIDAILSGNTIIIPPWEPAVQTALVLFAGISLLFVFHSSRRRTLPVTAIGLIVAILPPVFFYNGFYISPLYSSGTFSVLAVILLLLLWRQEEEKRRQIHHMFSRYVCPRVLNQITESPEQLGLGKKQSVSIMFTDIRGFTALSRDRDAHEVVKLLNLYFTPMVEIVRKHAGTTDKIIGDALMAYWNAPLERAGHAIDAVRAALEMQLSLPGINHKLQEEMTLEHNISVSIGVHMGEAFVGNMGPESFASYTLIGDNVNLASRLTGLSSQYDVGIVVSETVRNACAEAFFFQPLDAVTVKGRDDRPFAIYKPIPWEEANERKDELAMWEKVRLEYVAGDFRSVRINLGQLRTIYPDVGIYRMFAARMASLPENPPEDWDGTWAITEK